MNDKLRWETETPVVPDHVSMAEALNFVWSLPVSVLITGAETSTLIKEKIQMAKTFTKLSEEDRMLILERAGKAPDLSKVEYYKKV